MEILLKVFGAVILFSLFCTILSFLLRQLANFVKELAYKEEFKEFVAKNPNANFAEWREQRKLREEIASTINKYV